MTSSQQWPLRLGTAWLVAWGLAGCVPVAVKEPSVVSILSKKAETALIAGIRAYDEGNYAEAERHLNEALTAKLGAKPDEAAAHKYLAFIYCTSNRAADCARAFRDAHRVDPSFALDPNEAGHPLWGPVYRTVRAEIAKSTPQKL